MPGHPTARLTQKGSERVVIDDLENGRSPAELATENGISLRGGDHGLTRYRSGGRASLADRRSVRCCWPPSPASPGSSAVSVWGD